MNSLSENAEIWIREYTEGIYDSRRTDEAITALKRFLEINQKQQDDDYAVLIEQMMTLPDLEKKDIIWKFTNMELFIKSVLNTIGQDNTKTLGTLLLQLKKLPYGIEFNAADPSKYYGTYHYYLTVYQYRNLKTHNADIKTSIRKIQELITATLYCMLDISFTFRNELERTFLKGRFANIYDHKGYCKSIIEKYKNEKYVNLHWISYSKEDFDANKLVSIENNPIKILGEAGSGKSTILRRIAYLMASSAQNDISASVPVYISLSEVTGFYDVFLTQISAALSVSKENAQVLLENDKLVLLLDGYNEILNGDDLRSFSSQLDSFSIRYPSTKIFMSDRAITSDRVPVLKNAYKIYLKPLTLKDKKNFLVQVCTDKYVVRVIEEDMNANPATYEELDTPLKLQRYIDVVTAKREPSVDWTSDYIEMLLEREVNEKKDENADYLSSALAGVALAADENGEITPLKAQATIARVAGKLGYSGEVNARNLLNLAINMGLLTVVNGKIMFADEKFQWYFLMSAEESGLEGLLND